MLYSSSITIPANTAEASPTTQIMKVSKGVITRVMVRPRPGHAGLAHLTILLHEYQLYPTNPDGTLAGDQFPIDWNDHEELTSEPFELKLAGWNDDDTFEHTFDVYVAIIPRADTPGEILRQAMVDLLRTLIPRRGILGGN